MKKITIFFALIFLVFNTLVVPEAQALNPKVRVIFSTGVYGTLGGALLGSASLAFGTDGRTVAQGASIGLYLGLLFGSYVVLAHMAKKNKWGENTDDYYPDAPSPYENGGGGFNYPTEDQGPAAQRWNPYLEESEYKEISGWSSNPLERKRRYQPQ